MARNATDDLVARILRAYDTITVVGISSSPVKEAFSWCPA